MLPNYQKPLFEYTSHITFIKDFNLGNLIANWLNHEGFGPHYSTDYSNTIQTVKCSLMAVLLQTSEKFTYVEICRYILDNLFKILVEILYRNTTITTLYLSFREVSALVETFFNNTTTSNTLSLNRNQLGVEKGETLAVSLCKNITLTSLSLNGNKLGDEGESFCKNITLTSLSLDAGKNSNLHEILELTYPEDEIYHEAERREDEINYVEGQCIKVYLIEKIKSNAYSAKIRKNTNYKYKTRDERKNSYTERRNRSKVGVVEELSPQWVYSKVNEIAVTPNEAARKGGKNHHLCIEIDEKLECKDCHKQVKRKLYQNAGIFVDYADKHCCCQEGWLCSKKPCPKNGIITGNDTSGKLGKGDKNLTPRQNQFQDQFFLILCCTFTM